MRVEGGRCLLADGIPLEHWVDDAIDRSGPPKEGEFIYVDIGSIDRISKRIVDSKRIAADQAPSRARQVLKEGDVLVSMTRPNINAVAQVPAHLDNSIGSTGFHVLRPRFGNSGFLFYAVQTREFVEAMVMKVQGALYPAVRPNDISAFCLPPFSLAYQRRIVAKIEELFSELDAGIENFKRAREQLKVYRQALLKQAFEGKLTEKWRQENPDKLESADQLLARIRKEREARYQQQLNEWKAATAEWEKSGKKDKKPAKPKKLKPVEPLTGAERAELPELPVGWGWLRLAGANTVIFDGPFGSNLKTSDYVRSGVRVIRLENIGPGIFNEDKDAFITEEKYRSIAKHTVSHGDIVFSSFINDVVRAVIIPESIERAVNKADCFCVRCYGSSLRNDYLLQVFLARYFYKHLEAQVHGVGRPRINTTQLGAAPIPICSFPEQQEIVRILTEQFEAIEQNEREIDAALERAEALRQSILKKAFSGQLVPQDPNDEPASVLLERIREEREARVTTRNRGKGKTVKTRKRGGSSNK
jgi:type I restriction enzyme S subunit